MKAIPLAVAAALALGASAAYAQSDILKAKGCLGCHDLEKKKVGPSLKDIAAKHSGDAKAPAMLAAKLAEGKGHMKVKASEADIKALVEQVLATK